MTTAVAQATVTYLFSDIEGSTRLWETETERMRPTLAHHDAVCREVVAAHRGRIVKMTGDGVHAAFGDPRDALDAVLALQLAMADTPEGHVRLCVRSGLHAGADQHRDGDFFGPAVNRAARIMSAAHGGQVLVSETVAERVAGRLPDGVVLRDLGVARLRDLATPERLYQVLHPRLRADFPPLRSLEGIPNNLAPQLSSFVGRGRELAEVKALLARCRLLALLGMGGIGKSRLSIQVAAEVMDDFPDGVWFVELAPVGDPRSVPLALATVLGLREESDRPLLDTLLRHVADKKMLVVLDNCEHVIGACALLARQLLQAGPQVKVVASSRDYLRVTGEQAYQVPTLGAPAPGEADDDPAPEHLADHAAVRLFIDRARAVRPDLPLDAAALRTVARICHVLDGIPLALELAAARVRVLSLEAIATRLNDRFRLLVSGDRTASARQQTLRGLIDWSHDLLSEPERIVFARLSVFAGGWTLAAAEEIVAGGEVRAEDVLDVLAQLVEKSLVMLSHDGERYRMLDTVRAYAAERLAAMPDRAPVAERHARHYCAVARRFLAANQEETLRSAWAGIDADRDNVLQAVRGTAALVDGADDGSRAANALRLYFIRAGLIRFGISVFAELRDRPDFATRQRPRCRVVFAMGQLCFYAGRYDEAKVLLEEARAIAVEVGDRLWHGAVNQMLASLLVYMGDLAGADAAVDEAIRQAEAAANPREFLAARGMRALWFRAAGQVDEAATLYEELIADARRIGDVETAGLLILNLAIVSVRDRSRCRSALIDAFAACERANSEVLRCSTLEVCAAFASVCGAPRQSTGWLAVARARRHRSGLLADPLDARFIESITAEGRLDGPGPVPAAPGSVPQPSLDEALRDARSWLTAPSQ